MLKTKTITTEKATLLVVELPKGANRLKAFNDKDRPYISYFVGVETKRHYLPDGNWQLLGRLPDIKEDQASKVVVKSIHTGLYAHYVNGIPVNTYCYKESSDSLYSLLQSKEVYFENPLPKPKTAPYQDANFDIDEVNDWHESQSKVWDKDRCYLFIKVD